MEKIQKYPFIERHWESCERRQGDRRVHQRRRTSATTYFTRCRDTGLLMLLLLFVCGSYGVFLASRLTYESEQLRSTAIDMKAMKQAKVSETVIIEKGDTLSSIAQRAYGRSNRVEFLYQANRDTLENRNSLRPGQKINIP